MLVNLAQCFTKFTHSSLTSLRVASTATMLTKFAMRP